jgi:dihydropteroate synthase
MNKRYFKPMTWNLAHGRRLTLGPRALIMAIVNVTPNSFSDGGRLSTVSQAVEAALQMVEEGACILDIGGESTRPGAAPVDEAEECRRVIPVIEALSGKLGDAVISVDTYRAATARRAIEAGAHIINDVWGLQREPDIASVAAETGAGVCVMHSGRGRTVLDDPIADQHAYFSRSLEIAAAAGVESERIVLDPGFGFAKETAEINFQLMARLAELHALGYPLLAGASRKRFLGTVTGREAADRDVATAATSALLRMSGAAIFRVHNVAFNRDALAVTDAMIAQDPGA